ncbi:MAG: hypothetical protein ACJ763_05735 [Bdellovibrionia bacterium]
MKIQLFAIGAFALLSVSPSFASERDVSKETQEVVAALLSHDGAAKVAEFAKYADTVEEVKVNEMEDTTEYKITGIKLLGGDVVCGHGTLVIRKSYMPQFGFPFSRISTYQAEVSGQSSCQ